MRLALISLLILLSAGCAHKHNDSSTGPEDEWDEWDDTLVDSCWFGEQICIEANEYDNRSWCDGVGGSYQPNSCPLGTGMCEIPKGRDYNAPATSFFYGTFNGQGACLEVGGTYTAL